MEQLQVLDRSDLLEQQNNLLIRKFETLEQIETYKVYIKSLRDEIKGFDDDLRDLRVKLESSQLTLGVK